jgi:hypothetical protein
MTDEDRPQIGATAEADGVQTDYLEAGIGPPVELPVANSLRLMRLVQNGDLHADDAG